MSYTIYLGAFDKRLNSTKRPTLAEYSAWASYDCYLKHVTSYNKPTFVLSAEYASIAPNNYNYCIAFGRWYYVTDLRAVRTGICEIDLALDPMAAFQTEIKGTKAFIEYGFNTFDASDSSSRVTDSRRPVSKNPTIATASASLIGGALSATGSYILQVVSATRGVACYAVTYTQLQAIMLGVQTSLTGDIDGITADSDPTDEKATLDALVRLMGANYKQSLLAESAISSIKSIHWLPLSWGSISGTSEEIYLGSYSTGQYGTRLPNNALWTNTASVSIPWQATDWRRNNSQISLYLPFFGTVPVPVDQCIGQGTVSATLSLDILSGDLTIRVTAGSQTIYTGSTNISAPYAVGVSAVTAGSKLSGGIQAVTGGMEMAAGAIDAGAGVLGAVFGGIGGSVAGGVASMGAGAQAMMSGYSQTVQPLITSAGSMGGIASLGQSTDMILTMLYWPVITDSDFESIYGHPVFKVDTPANGFCKTRGFSISLANNAQYAAYINAVMDGGAFIED